MVGCALAAGLLPPFRTPAGNGRSDLYYPHQAYVAAADMVGGLWTFRPSR